MDHRVIGGDLYRMTPQDGFRVCTLYMHTWMRHDKLPPEACLGLEVDNETALLIYTHTGGVQGSYEYRGERFPMSVTNLHFSSVKTNSVGYEDTL